MQVVNPVSSEEVVAEMRRYLDVAAVPQDVVLTARAGDASTTIIDEAVTSNADLIVMGTHSHRGFKRLLLGSVTETVLREAPCAVLTVPPHAPAGSPSRIQAHSLPDRFLTVISSGARVCVGSRPSVQRHRHTA